VRRSAAAAARIASSRCQAAARDEPPARPAKTTHDSYIGFRSESDGIGRRTERAAGRVVVPIKGSAGGPAPQPGSRPRVAPRVISVSAV